MTITCPVCQRVILKPGLPLLRSVPWGECACTDDGPCVAHRYDAADMPTRPDPKVLAKRAQDEQVHRMARYEAVKRQVAEYEKLVRQRDALLAAARKTIMCFEAWVASLDPEVDEATNERLSHESDVAMGALTLAVAACEEGGEG